MRETFWKEGSGGEEVGFFEEKEKKKTTTKGEYRMSSVSILFPTRKYETRLPYMETLN